MSGFREKTLHKKPDKKGFLVGFGAYVRKLSPKRRAFWILLFSLIGGGLAAVISYGLSQTVLTNLSILGVSSILGISGIALPLLLISIWSTLLTLSILLFVVRYLVQTAKIPRPIFIILVLFTSLVFALGGALLVATAPSLLAALSFGLGPLASFFIAGGGLGLIGFFAAFYLYNQVGAKSQKEGPQLIGQRNKEERETSKKEDAQKREKMEKLLGLDKKGEDDEKFQEDLLGDPLEKKIQLNSDDIQSITDIIDDIEDPSEKIQWLKRVINNCYLEHRDYVYFANTYADALFTRGGRGDYLQAKRVFDYLAHNTQLSEADSATCEIARVRGNIAAILAQYLDDNPHDENNRNSCVSALMKTVLAELHQVAGAFRNLDEKEKNNKLRDLTLLIQTAARIDPYKRSATDADAPPERVYEDLITYINDDKINSAIHCINANFFPNTPEDAKAEEFFASPLSTGTPNRKKSKIEIETDAPSKRLQRPPRH